MSRNLTLDEIGLKYGTDKASCYHDYLNFYETFFAKLRNEKLQILEIGVFGGASLKTWEEYFPQATVIGADIVPSSKQYERGRVIIELLDQSNIDELLRVSLTHGPFDIVIEDGSHMWEHQITSLRTLFPFLKNDGLYIVEDLQTNYGAMQRDYKGIASSTCMDYLKRWVDLRVGDDQVPLHEVEDAFLRTYGRAAQFMTFYRRACLIKKRALRLVRENNPGRKLVELEGDDAGPAVCILAHVSTRGDVFGPAGFVNPDGAEYAFQGLSIETDDDVLEYRVRGPDEVWSDWAHGKQFLGSRGQAKLLTGITMRLRDGVRDRLTLRGFCRFIGSGEAVELVDGEDCVSVNDRPLCGLQIAVSERIRGF